MFVYFGCWVSNDLLWWILEMLLNSVFAFVLSVVRKNMSSMYLLKMRQLWKILRARCSILFIKIIAIIADMLKTKNELLKTTLIRKQMSLTDNVCSAWARDCRKLRTASIASLIGIDVYKLQTSRLKGYFNFCISWLFKDLRQFIRVCEFSKCAGICRKAGFKLLLIRWHIR